VAKNRLIVKPMPVRMLAREAQPLLCWSPGL
jgi:hypothetical protein